MDVITLLLEYLIAVNLIGFALMGIDKYKAKKKGLPDSGSNPFYRCNNWRKHRFHYWNVCFSS